MTTLEQAIKDAADKLASFKVPRISPILGPDGDDYRELHDRLSDIAQYIFDPVIQAFGEYAAANYYGKVDLSVFKKRVEYALDGEALYELTRIAEQLDEDSAEQMGAAE